MKVKSWISPYEADKYDIDRGSIGGFFSNGMRWKDYIESFKPEYMEYYEAIRDDIINKDLEITGENHQNSKNGIPLFEDDSIATFSFRGWGDLMAAIFSELDNKDYNYMDFYYFYWNRNESKEHGLK